MKHRTVIVAICILLSFVLSSCRMNKQSLRADTDDTIEFNEGTSAVPGIDTVTPNTTIQGSDNPTDIFLPDYVETPNLTLESYDDYQLFLISTDLPTDFVEYEELSHFGSFRSFVCLTDSRCGDYSQYMYNLVGPNNAKLSITIIDTDKHETTLYSTSGTMDVNRSDMRQTTDQLSGSHTENGICYTYVSGKLLCIAWQSGNLTFVVSGNSMLCDYPNNATTSIAELLCISGKTQVEIQAILSNGDVVTE